jgi:hypothetical protein
VQRRYRAGIADIALEGVDAVERPFDRIELFLIAAGDDQRITALVKLLRQFEPDATGSTR